jgi:hypothetical protein
MKQKKDNQSLQSPIKLADKIQTEFYNHKCKRYTIKWNEMAKSQNKIESL